MGSPTSKVRRVRINLRSGMCHHMPVGQSQPTRDMFWVHCSSHGSSSQSSTTCHSLWCHACRLPKWQLRRRRQHGALKVGTDGDKVDPMGPSLILPNGSIDIDVHGWWIGVHCHGLPLGNDPWNSIHWLLRWWQSRLRSTSDPRSNATNLCLNLLVFVMLWYVLLFDHPSNDLILLMNRFMFKIGKFLSVIYPTLSNNDGQNASSKPSKSGINQTGFQRGISNVNDWEQNWRSKQTLATHWQCGMTNTICDMSPSKIPSLAA